jgi:hypothetical protein
MRYAGRFFLLIVVLSGMAVAQGGQFWEKKDYRQWSKRDCERLLKDSPWAREYTLSQVVRVTVGDRGAERGREANPTISYQVQFRSALPVRQALVRLSQIEQKYDALSPDQQQTLDQKAQPFLAEDFSETVLVYVSYSANVQANDIDMARFWQNQTTDKLKNGVYLIGSKGDKFPLLHYSVAGGSGREFQFVFPRQHEGRPLLSPGDKVLKLEFYSPHIQGQGGTLFIEFKPEKMLVNGALVY